MGQEKVDDRAAKASEQTAPDSALLEKVADFYHVQPKVRASQRV